MTQTHSSRNEIKTLVALTLVFGLTSGYWSEARLFELSWR